MVRTQKSRNGPVKGSLAGGWAVHLRRAADGDFEFGRNVAPKLS